MASPGGLCMNQVIHPGPRSGSVRIPASKSQAHRLLICAALASFPCVLCCDGVSADISATIACLNALGATITAQNDRIFVEPIRTIPADLCELPCGESGSTLRFLLPLVGALGANAVFRMEGRLPARPLTPLDHELCTHGMSIRQEGELLYCSGGLAPGSFTLPGNVSSQYISGLLMALPLLKGDSRLSVTGKVESSAYITMTEDALGLSGLAYEKQGWNYRIPGGQKPSLPHTLCVEGDWSNAAFFLCAGALSPKGIRVSGLNLASFQGDRAVLEILGRFGAEIAETEDAVCVRRARLVAVEIDASSIPDLIPVLSVVAAGVEGETRIHNAARLRLKESDRLASTAAMLKALGSDVTELPDGLLIRGRTALRGGAVDAFGDHRIAMSAAVAACLCGEELTVCGSECVKKSYPRFWEDWEGLTL